MQIYNRLLQLKWTWPGWVFFWLVFFFFFQVVYFLSFLSFSYLHLVYLEDNVERSNSEELHINPELLIYLKNGKARKSRGREQKPKLPSKMLHNYPSRDLSFSSSAYCNTDDDSDDHSQRSAHSWCFSGTEPKSVDIYLRYQKYSVKIQRGIESKLYNQKRWNLNTHGGEAGSRKSRKNVNVFRPTTRNL